MPTLAMLMRVIGDGLPSADCQSGLNSLRTTGMAVVLTRYTRECRGDIGLSYAFSLQKYKPPKQIGIGPKHVVDTKEQNLLDLMFGSVNF